jgi:hypothetical protein
MWSGQAAKIVESHGIGKAVAHQLLESLAIAYSFRYSAPASLSYF